MDIAEVKEITALLDSEATGLFINSNFVATEKFCCYIFVSLFDVKILNIILYMSRHGVYACVRRWAICVRLRGV